MTNALIIATYPDEWIKKYESKYFEIDPLVKLARRRILPIDWSRLKSQNKHARLFFAEIERCGIGNQGISVPIRGVGSERALMTATKMCSDTEWENKKGFLLERVTTIAPFVHEKVMMFTGLRELDGQCSLTPRESCCLKLIASGKSPKEAAGLLNISDTMVRMHLRSACDRLQCKTVESAVAVAVETEILEQE